jgi:hypothetical protein
VSVTTLLNNTNGVSMVASDASHTVEAWIKVNALPQTRAWPILLGNAGNGAHHWLLNSATYPVNPGKLRVGIFNGGTVEIPVTVGAWMHVAAVYNSTGNTIVGYVNGRPFGTNIAGLVNLQGIPLALGAATGQDAFNGVMDEVRIWRTNRSAAEIAASYNQRLVGNELGLVAYYPFDETTGSAIKSKALGEIPATLAGNPTRVVRGGLPAPSITVSEPAPTKRALFIGTVFWLVQTRRRRIFRARVWPISVT